MSSNASFQQPIAALTGGGSRAGKHSLMVRISLSGPVPGSGSRGQDQALDEVSAAILGDAVSENVKVTGAEPALSAERPR